MHRRTILLYLACLVLVISAVTATAEPSGVPDDLYWYNGFSNTNKALDGSISSLTIYDGQLIAAGSFTNWGTTSLNRIAAWDGFTWSPLGSGVAGVTDMIVYDGKLIVAGTFSEAGGISANSVAAWNGTSWAPLGDGLIGSVHCLAIFDNKLIAGGVLWRTGDLSSANIFAWDGSTWEPLGTGVDSWVGALAVYNGKLIAGGAFTDVGNYIASWDGADWGWLAEGMHRPVEAMGVHDGKLWVINDYVMSWDGNSWTNNSPGVDNYSVCFKEFGGELLVGGRFSTVSGNAAQNIASLHGVTWSPLGSGVWNNPDATLSDMLEWGGRLVVAGSFQFAGDKYAPYIAGWEKVPTCCMGATGNVDMTGIIDLADLSRLIAYLTVPFPAKPYLPCDAEANVGGSDIVDLIDLSTLVAYLTVPAPNKPVLPFCP